MRPSSAAPLWLFLFALTVAALAGASASAAAPATAPAAPTTAPATRPASASAKPEAVVVRARILRAKLAPATAPAQDVSAGVVVLQMPTTVPADATEEVAVETLAAVGGPYRCRATANDGSAVKLEGTLRRQQDKRVFVGIEFERRTVDGLQGVKSSVLLELNQPMILSGSFGAHENDHRLIELTLLPHGT